MLWVFERGSRVFWGVLRFVLPLALSDGGGPTRSCQVKDLGRSATVAQRHQHDVVRHHMETSGSTTEWVAPLGPRIRVTDASRTREVLQ